MATLSASKVCFSLLLLLFAECCDSVLFIVSDFVLHVADGFPDTEGGRVGVTRDPDSVDQVMLITKLLPSDSPILFTHDAHHIDSEGRIYGSGWAAADQGRTHGFVLVRK